MFDHSVAQPFRTETQKGQSGTFCEQLIPVATARCIEFRSKSTLPLPPPVEGGGSETLSPGGRGEGEGDCILKRQSAILDAGNYKTARPLGRYI